MQDTVQQTPEKPVRNRLSASDEVRYGALFMLAAGAVNTFVLPANAPIGRVGVICALLILISGPALHERDSSRSLKAGLSAFVALSIVALMALVLYGWVKPDRGITHVADAVEDAYIASAMLLAFVLPRLRERSLNRTQEAEA